MDLLYSSIHQMLWDRFLDTVVHVSIHLLPLCLIVPADIDIRSSALLKLLLRVDRQLTLDFVKELLVDVVGPSRLRATD